jgi:hypothetical protein
VIGALERHHCQGAGDKPNLGIGSLLFDSPAALAHRPEWPHWQLSTLDPLTIHPSVLCRSCGLHGWIKEGKWVPC